MAYTPQHRIGEIIEFFVALTPKYMLCLNSKMESPFQLKISESVGKIIDTH